MPKLKDLIGRRFGELTVLSRDENMSGRSSWVCACSCGSKVTVPGGSLTSGNTKSCGHLKTADRFEDLTGRRFGKLTVLKHERVVGKNHQWMCICDCGNEKVIAVSSLRSGATKSCGCLAKETSKRVHTKHGYSGSRTYETWKGMHGRCSNPRNRAYQNYGGRGIDVCARWGSFENFVKDMGECPENHSIDRIDNSKGYTPDNCRWASTTVQNRNRRNNSYHSFCGVTMCTTAWAEFSGVPVRRIEHRLKTNWSFGRAIEFE